jgi:hypothetical protein
MNTTSGKLKAGEDVTLEESRLVLFSRLSEQLITTSGKLKAGLDLILEESRLALFSRLF